MNFQLGLNLYPTKVILFEPSNLDSIKETLQKDKYHIYLICKRKKTYFESSEPDGPDFCKTVLYYLNEQHEKVFLRYRHPSTLRVFAHADGFYQIEHQGQPGELADFLLINNFSFQESDTVASSSPEPRPADLEVMYIGQSFGRTTLRTIDYRLANHEKIQKVALEILRAGSNEEVLIIGLNVEARDLATSFINADTATSPVTVEELTVLQKQAAQRLTEGQQLTVYEAALITYFQPRLNTEYKSTFPSPDFKSYDELYSTAFNYTSMTIDTLPAFVRIYSAHVPERKYVHTQHYPLTTKGDKKEFFQYLFELARASA